MTTPVSPRKLDSTTAGHISARPRLTSALLRNIVVGAEEGCPEPTQKLRPGRPATIRPGPRTAAPPPRNRVGGGGEACPNPTKSLRRGAPATPRCDRARPAASPDRCRRPGERSVTRRTGRRLVDLPVRFLRGIAF